MSTCNVVTVMKRGGTLSNHFVASLLLTLSVKEFSGIG